MEKSLLVNVLGGAAVSFGVVAVAAPEVMHSAYGMSSTPTSRALLRLWGTRTATLGALALRASAKDQDDILLAIAAMNGLDAVLDVAALRDGVTGRTAGATAATSAAFFALLLVARNMD